VANNFFKHKYRQIKLQNLPPHKKGMRESAASMVTILTASNSSLLSSTRINNNGWIANSSSSSLPPFVNPFAINESCVHIDALILHSTSWLND